MPLDLNDAAPQPKPSGLINSATPSLLSGDPTDPQVTEDVPASVMEPPAIFANGYYVTASPTLVRIAFSESTDGVLPIYRSAVVMGADDAKALAELLLKLMGEVDPVQEKEPK